MQKNNSTNEKNNIKTLLLFSFHALVSQRAHVISVKKNIQQCYYVTSCTQTISGYRFILQEVIIQGRELAERANEMSTRNLRDRRPLQTASKVLLSDLTNLSSKVEHTKRWLEDAVNFYNLLKKVNFHKSRV